MASTVKECKSKSWYQNLHTKLVKENGNANTCENINCNYINPKRFEWALKKGSSYSDNINDYIQLCPSCHRKYDQKDENVQKLSKRVTQFDMNWNFIAEYKSMSEAARIVGITNSMISRATKMTEYKSAGGFRWKTID